jgi:hypothetical protein
LSFYQNSKVVGVGMLKGAKIAKPGKVQKEKVVISILLQILTRVSF